MEELRSLARNDVFILGAGFSKAVAANFPLAADLLKPIRTRLSDQLGAGVQRRGGEGFEQWLSRLAEDQPYLPPDTNLERAAAFQRVSTEVGKILTDHENTALGNSEPEWLAKLIATWHIRHATVVSFNYDNLVEAAVLTQQSWLQVTEHDILRRLPPLPPSLMSEEAPARVSSSVGHTFRLLKLHGSISWYWDDGDNGGATLQRWPYIGQFLEPRGDQTEDIARQFPGRVPFIAPPSATKSKYLGNRVLRDFWREALYALQKAENVYFLGYSVPPQDQAAMSLIIEGVGDRKPQIHILDIDADTVRGNLANLLVDYKSLPGESKEGILRKKVEELKCCYGLKLHPGGDNPIKEGADAYFKELLEEGARNLTRVAKSLAPITPENLEESWDGPDDGAKFPITGSVMCPNLPIRTVAPLLDCDDACIDGDALKVRVGNNKETDALQLTKLMRYLQGDTEIRRIIGLYDDGSEIPVIPLALQPTASDHLTGGNWWTLHLTPFITQTPSDPPNYSEQLKRP